LLFSELSAQKIGIINDPDGYTNIRSGQGMNYDIVGKINEADEFNYFPDSESNWWAVETIPRIGTPLKGYVHKSRIQPYYPEESVYCNCHQTYNTQDTKPVMSTQVGHINLAICGYLLQRQSAKSIKISGFTITNCETDEVIRSYGDLRTCQVIYNGRFVEIFELIRLPIGKGFQWIQTPYKTVELSDVSGAIAIGKEQFVLDLSDITDSDVNSFVDELPSYKGKGYFDEVETFIGKLLVCTLKGNKQCEAVFNDIRNYLDYALDGAASEFYSDCTSVLENSKSL